MLAKQRFYNVGVWGSTGILIITILSQKLLNHLNVTCKKMWVSFIHVEIKLNIEVSHDNMKPLIYDDSIKPYTFILLQSVSLLLSHIIHWQKIQMVTISLRFHGVISKLISSCYVLLTIGHAIQLQVASMQVIHTCSYCEQRKCEI